MLAAFPKSSRAADRPPLVEREPTLWEMLDDPIVIRLMRRDGVTVADVLSMFTTPARGRLCRAA